MLTADPGTAPCLSGVVPDGISELSAFENPFPLGLAGVRTDLREPEEFSAGMLASFCDGSEIGQRGALIEPAIVVEGKEELVGFSEEFSASPCVTIF